MALIARDGGHAPIIHIVPYDLAPLGIPTRTFDRPTYITLAFWGALSQFILDVVEQLGTKMIVGYARTSTIEQVAGLEAQERDLGAAGVEKLFGERVSSVADRTELKKALDYLRDGDVFVVTKLDRLARSIPDLVAIVDKIAAKGASLRIMNPDIDTKTPTGKLMLNLLGSIAQFERELMLERQREGIAKAKSEGKYKGRKATARAQAEAVLNLHRNGAGATSIARQVGIGRSSVYRILQGDK